jgi:hypothetical protein
MAQTKNSIGDRMEVDPEPAPSHSTLGMISPVEFENPKDSHGVHAPPYERGDG